MSLIKNGANVLADYDAGKLEHVRIDKGTRNELRKLGCIIVGLTYNKSHFERDVTFRFAPHMSLLDAVKATRLLEHICINGFVDETKPKGQPDGSVIISAYLD